MCIQPRIAKWNLTEDGFVFFWFGARRKTRYEVLKYLNKFFFVIAVALDNHICNR